MSEYDNVRLGKLVLKGETKKRKKQKHKNKDKSSAKKPKTLVDEDAVKHGGWGKVDKHADISGTVAVEFGSNTYLKALDNGLFTLGAPHPEGEAPSPEEILTVIQINGNKIAFKSGYGKYLKVEKDGVVTGRSDAVGSMEQWEAVFEDGKAALQSELGTFMSIDPEDDACVALRKTAGEREMLSIRMLSHRKLKENEDDNPEEETDLKQTEIMHVKKFQKFQDKKMRINTGELQELETARATGTLHETLLDRRSKMKSDRYCK